MTTVSPGFALRQCMLRLKVGSQKRTAGVEAFSDGGSDEKDGATERAVALVVVDRDSETCEVFVSAELLVCSAEEE